MLSGCNVWARAKCDENPLAETLLAPQVLGQLEMRRRLPNLAGLRPRSGDYLLGRECVLGVGAIPDPVADHVGIGVGVEAEPASHAPGLDLRRSVRATLGHGRPVRLRRPR